MDKPQTRMGDQSQPGVICVFVSAALRDTQTERDYLYKFTFPWLRELCASRGVILKVLDLREKIASEDTAPEDVLQLTLEELQRSRPYYIGLIGEDYGSVVEQLPGELLNRWPLLVQFDGRSTNELEIVCGVLTDEAMHGRGFFYFRDPKSTDINSQETSKESGQSSNDPQNLDVLKDTILLASREGICRLRENYRSFEELGQWILDDFQQLIDKLWAAPERPTEVKPYDDDVMLTVYRPETVIPQQWYSLLAFAHLSQRRPNAPADEPDPLAEVHRQAQQILGEKMDEYRQSSQDSSNSVPQSGEITFKPFITGFEFNPSRRSFRWEESVHREEFKLRAITAPDGEVAKGWLRVYLGPLILAQINLSIRVNSKFVSQPGRQAPRMESTRPLRKVFASYSHKDRAIVERIEEIVSQTRLGIEYLRDLRKLRAGEVWSPRLMEMIREAQAFQLFWSTNSMRSDFVRQEYEYALALRREDFIRPVYWEIPFPEKPEDGLPPEELRCLHFEQLAESDEFVKCPHCGRMGSRGDTYCRACGARYSTTSDTTLDVTSEIPEPTVGPPVMAAPSPTQASTHQDDLLSTTRQMKRSRAGPALLTFIFAATITAGAMSLGVWFISKTDTADTSIRQSTNANSDRQFGTGGVEGSVTDRAGHPLVNMTVGIGIRNGPNSKTDENGHFVLNDIPAGVQLIEAQSPSNKRRTQSLMIPPNQTASVSLIYDPEASQLGLLSVTHPVDRAVLKVDRVDNEFEKVIYGRCDGLQEILGPFKVWVLIQPVDDSRVWLQRPPAIIDSTSNTWQARVVFGNTEHPWSNGRRFYIVAIATRSESDIKEDVISTPRLNLLPPHIRSNVVTVVAIDR